MTQVAGTIEVNGGATMPNAKAPTKPCRLESVKVEQLEARMRGYLIRPSDDAYDGARAVWNGMIDRRPARRRAQCRGQCGLRRWAGHRPLGYEVRAR